MRKINMRRKKLSFAIKERGKGAPKKEKRLKGVLEIKSKKKTSSKFIV